MAKRPWKTPNRTGKARGHRSYANKRRFGSTLLDALKKVKAFVWATAAVVSAVTGWYAKTYLDIKHDREARLAKVDAFLSALKRDKDSTSREISFDSLELARLTDHLEPHVVVGLLQMIRAERPLRARCVAPTPGAPGALPPGLSHALRIVWLLQQRQIRVHPLTDRIVDQVLGEMQPALVEPARAISLSNTDLRGADLHGVMLQSALFHGACLAGARLDSALLDSADFSGATLRSASLTGARGAKTKFTRAVLVDADLSGSTFSHANFRGANLSCATLGNAHLDSAYFSDAVATWAFFGGAVLQGIEKWTEVRDLRKGYMASVSGLPDSVLAWSRSRGAVNASEDQAAWTAGRMAQLRNGGLCAVDSGRPGVASPPS